MVGLLGLIAIGHTVDTDSSNDLGQLLTLLPGLEGIHEDEDRDAVLAWLAPTGEHTCTVVQFKYSSIHQPKVIHRKEFVKIVNQLAKTALPAQTSKQPVSRFALVTNRPLAANISTCLEPLNERVRTWKQECDLNPTLDEDILSTLTEMTFVTGSMDYWGDGLRNFAKQYGVLDDEMEAGIHRLCGLVALQTTHGETDARVTRDVLKKTFTGSDRAVRLVPDSVRESAIDAVQRFARDLVWVRDAPVWRDKQEELSDAARTFPVVLVTGEGGSGKTVGVWKWADENSHAVQGMGPFTDAVLASDVTGTWVHDLVWRWRGMDGTRDERGDDPDRSIRRLFAANGDLHRPILHLALDGLDALDDSQPREAIRELIQWLVEHHPTNNEQRNPPCTLVVSCRSKKEMEERLWLDKGFEAGKLLALVETVQFGDFEPQDLEIGARVAAGQGGLEPDIAERLAQAFRAHPRTTTPSHRDFAGVPLVDDRAAGQVPTFVLDALRHPVLWGAFLYLDSADLRSAVLAGDQHGMNALADKFVGRFQSQTRDRLEAKVGRHGMVQDVLISVAHWMKERRKKVVTRRNWTRAAMLVGDVHYVLASDLLSEAISGGVLAPSLDGWTWRHEFVGIYLGSIAGL
jgi:hypothetical protein